MNLKLTNTAQVSVTAQAGGTSIGDQSTLRGRKVRGIIALTGADANGTALVAPSAAFITLATKAGRIVHENLNMGLLVPQNNGGVVHELGNEEIDWTKSTVKAAGLVSFSVIYE